MSAVSFPVPSGDLSRAQVREFRVPAIPVTVLTYRRPRYLAMTLDSFALQHAAILSSFSFRALVHGGRHWPTEKILEQRASLIPSVEVIDDNPGGGVGFSRLMAAVIQEEAPYVLHLEDDWLSAESLEPYMGEILDFMAAHREVGQIRLRDVRSPVSKVNPFTKKEIVWQPATEHIKVGNAHFTFNPAITRASILPQIVPCKSEREACIKYTRLNLLCGQLQAGCFGHIGAEKAGRMAE